MCKKMKKKKKKKKEKKVLFISRTDKEGGLVIIEG